MTMNPNITLRMHQMARLAARAILWLYMPFLTPTLIFLVIFTCTYMHIMPLRFQAYFTGIVLLFTLALPLLAIHVLRRLMGWHVRELGGRGHRLTPYLLTFCSYLACFFLLKRLHLPFFMWGTILSSLACLTLCWVVGYFHKASLHMASSGFMIGTLLAFGLMFSFNPLMWLSVFVLLSGLLGTALMILEMGGLSNILAGFLIGVACGLSLCVMI